MQVYPVQHKAGYPVPIALHFTGGTHTGLVTDARSSHRGMGSWLPPT
jgi:hypothetical protein